MYQILLYYKYTPIADPELFRREQWDLCQRLHLKGRIIVGKEGLNGTVEGTLEATEEYVKTLRADHRFADIHMKRSAGTGKAFPKLSVKVRAEIVSGHLFADDVNPREVTGKYLQPEELHAWIKDGKEFYIVDMRNDYEHKVGHFAGSILPPLENFRDLPKTLPILKHLKDKTILTVCTGGVRCEKASGFLVKHGFKDVYQLAGGIVSYMEKYPGEDFKGSLYVFDGRVTMAFGEHEVIGKCERCGKASERYVNCANLRCHKHFICCESCAVTNEVATCSLWCRIRVGLQNFKKMLLLWSKNGTLRSSSR
jgi:UPF0176 protein